MLTQLKKKLQRLEAKLTNFIKWGLSKSRIVGVILAIASVEAKIEKLNQPQEIDLHDFEGFLKSASKIVDYRKRAILGTVYIGNGKAIASDLENFLIYRSESLNFNPVCIDHFLIEKVTKVQDKTQKIFINSNTNNDNNLLQLKTETGEYNLKGHNALEFPQINDNSQQLGSFKFDKTFIQELKTAVKFIGSYYENYLSQVGVKIENNLITVSSSNGHIINKSEVKTNCIIEKPLTFSISKTTIESLGKLNVSEGQATIYQDDDNYIVEWGMASISLTHRSNPYIIHHEKVSQSSQFKPNLSYAVCDRKRLINSLKSVMHRVDAMNKKVKLGMVEIEFNQENQVIILKSESGTVKINSEVTKQKSIFVNPQLLLKVLNQVKDKDLCLHYSQEMVYMMGLGSPNFIGLALIQVIEETEPLAA